MVFGARSMYTLAGLAGIGNIGRGIGGVATGRYGATAAGAFYGAGAGALWGMGSSDTSVLGGAMIGAGLGAGGVRYGGAGLRRAALGRRGIGVGGSATVTGIGGASIGFGRGVYNRARMDFRSARLATNRIGRAVASTLRDRGPMTPWGHVL